MSHPQQLHVNTTEHSDISAQTRVRARTHTHTPTHTRAPLEPFAKVRDGETTIKIKVSLSEGGGLGAERKIVQNAVFFVRGKRHDNKILEVLILLSRNFVVIARAPKGV